MQNEYRLTLRADNVNVRWTVVVRIDHDPQTIEAQDDRHNIT
jgi:hypothetical protein